jgi:threonine dehydrogenase-like Zn-dependent dehydrogenase
VFSVPSVGFWEEGSVLAAQLTAPGVISCAEVPSPAVGAADEDEVLIETAVSTICGSDVHVYASPVGLVPYPCPHGYPGHETVGKVIDTTTDLLPVGTMVLAVPDAAFSAAFAEYQVIPTRFALPYPEGLRPEEVVIAQQLGTVVFALKRFSQPAADVALVLGAGTAGIFFANRLKAAGHEKVIVADLDAYRLERALAYGADVTVHVPHDDVESVVRDLTGGEGCDLVIEAAGYDASRATAVACVRRFGFIGLFGLPEHRGDVPFPMHDFFRKQAVMRSVTQTQHERGLSSFREAVGLIATRSVPIDDLITHRFSLDAIGAALVLAGDYGSGVGKVAVTFN